MSTKGEYVEILDFCEGNEESSEEITGCKASAYAEFDDCPRTGNLVEILRFTYFAHVFKFSGQRNFGRKKEISEHQQLKLRKESQDRLFSTSLNVKAGGLFARSNTLYKMIDSAYILKSRNQYQSCTACTYNP